MQARHDIKNNSIVHLKQSNFCFLFQQLFKEANEEKAKKAVAGKSNPAQKIIKKINGYTRLELHCTRREPGIEFGGRVMLQRVQH